MRRRLDAELVRRGLVASRSRASEVIRAGRVLVAGAHASSPARQVAAADAITVRAPRPQFVSRGGEKLAGALDRFGVDVSGRRALDAGASTGGFTDCLLQAGAARVYAVDVGRGQLAWSLRSDARVELLERTNVRTLELEHVGEPVDVVAADLSFISLLTVAPALVRCARLDADFLLLVKPQFEVGRGQVGKGGVVRDPTAHRRVVRDVASGLATAGLLPVGVVASPRRGADGNVEFFLHCRADGGGGAPVDDTAVAAAVTEAHASPPTAASR